MQYFTLNELIKSNTAIRRGIDNTPNSEQIKNLELLVCYILDPLRKYYGKPIIVNSGFRCKILNDIVGGSKNSDHQYGYAADIRSIKNTKQENKKLFDLVLKLNLPFDQLINEHDYDWVHVSYSPKNRRQVLHIK